VEGSAVVEPGVVGCGALGEFVDFGVWMVERIERAAT
jgi:hypothetical protein